MSYQQQLQKVFLDGIGADLKAMEAFQDKCFSDYLESLRTGNFNPHFDGFLSRMKQQPDLLLEGREKLLSKIDDNIIARRRR